jgi:acyl dehydratase
MAIDPAYLLGLPPRIIDQSLTRRDTILYALGVGAGQDVAGSDDLRFVYEDKLVALPTMAAVLANPGFWLKDSHYGVNWKLVLHAEQSVTIHSTLPVEGEIRGELTVDNIVDKGANKGALVYSTRRVFDVDRNVLLASVRQVAFLRGDGGCGGSSYAAPEPHPVPDRTPDARFTLPTRSEQALIYRLSGDYNPLHADPAVARDAGLPHPILHGLCTYGIAGRAILKTLCRNDPARLKRLDCRFSAPVFPGEDIEVSMWRVCGGRAAFQAHAVARGVLVLNHGYVEFED